MERLTNYSDCSSTICVGPIGLDYSLSYMVAYVFFSHGTEKDRPYNFLIVS